MSETWVKDAAEWAAAAVEILGIAVILGAAVIAVITGIAHYARRGRSGDWIHDVRQRLGRGILLGLEFLVAADIIYTVAVELTFESVGVLAIVVLIRTLLSFTLEVELTGRWPWQKRGSGPE